MDLTRSTALITGGGGFLGSHLKEELSGGFRSIVAPRSSDFNLISQDQTNQMVGTFNPDVIFHLAATVGGIGANRENPGLYFYNNMMMGCNIIEAARIHKVPKIVVVGTICAYPHSTPVPFKEENLWNGYPESTNAPYGVAKKALLVMCQAYRQQYELNAVYLLPVNLYGPRDNFDLESSHVIPALIRKVMAAKDNNQDQVELWGTGAPSREFLYVKDAARAIRLAAEKYDGKEPINLGTGNEIRIRDLADMIKDIIGWSGKFTYNTSKPDGQPRRCLDVTRAKDLLDFTAEVSLRDGLSKTIDWYASK
jgi:GDP-L-fucose synthase